MSLADIIVTGKAAVAPYHDPRSRELTERLKRLVGSVKSCPRIDVTSASSYVYETSDKEDWPARDFPSLAPPFKMFWVEHETPRSINNSGNIIERNAEQRSHSPRVGALVTSFELPDPGPGRVSAVEEITTLSNVRTGTEYAEKFMRACIDSGTRWIVMSELVSQVQSDMFMYLGYAEFWAVAGEGEVRADYARMFAHSELAFDFTEMGGDLSAIRFGISLMHCKNVSLEEAVPEKRRNPYTRRGQRPRLQMHTLLIDPMRRILATEGDVASNGLKQAMHICRGHFKDYRQSGLFGKIKGVFWWDSSVKGSASQGIVAKDYTVKAPPTPEGNA